MVYMMDNRLYQPDTDILRLYKVDQKSRYRNLILQLFEVGQFYQYVEEI